MPDIYEELFGERAHKKRAPRVPLEVITLFEKLALEAAAAGWEHYSARAVAERIRWHYHVDIGNRDFKLGNNWVPYMSRWFMLTYPHLDGFFFKRTANADFTENRHMKEDAT